MVDSRAAAGGAAPEQAARLSTAGHGIRGQLLDRFRLQRAVSVQGCLAVYEALAPDGSPVAVRAVCIDGRPSLQRRLDNEYASLNHLSGFGAVPAVLATGRTDTERYLVTQWLPGTHLASIGSGVGPETPTPPLPEVAAAFAHLHVRGVVHGDVNRRNVLVAPCGAVHIIDFESSRRLDGNTPVGPVHGPVATRFAAPEYFHARRGPAPFTPTPASEQYAIAAVFYRQLTSHYHRNIPADSSQDTGPPPTGAFALDGPSRSRWPALADILATALATDPADRFPSTSDFAHALRRAIAPTGTRDATQPPAD